VTTAIDFPNSPPPNDGDTYTASNGITYTFQGGRWTGNTALPPTDRLVSNGHEVVLGSDGVLTVGDIVPLTAANKFGSITNPFKDIYVSQGSIVIADQNINTDAVNISNTSGYLVFSRGGLKVTANDNLHEIFQLDNTGKLLIKSEIPVIQDNAAFEVIGNLQGTSLGVYNYGVMIHSSGAVDIPSRMYIDGVGTQISGQSAYAAFIGRHARGTVLSPQAVEADDIIVRFGGNAYANTIGLNTTSNVRIDMVATETQSDTNRGSKIELWTTPTGSPDPNLSLSVSSDGLIFPYGSTIRDYAYHSGTPANLTLTAIGNTSAIWRLLSDGTTEFPNYTFPAAHGTANQVLVDNGSGVLSWVNGPVGYTGSIGNTGYTGSQGVKGDTGTAVELLGSKATIADLPAAPTNWNDFAGHGWIVITGDGMTHGDGNLWFWNLSTGQWDDVGQITGPQGIQGVSGYTGSIGSTGYSGSLGYTGSAGYAGNDGYTGSKGDRGYTGSIGYTGSQGVGYTGSAGTNGYTGSKGSDGVIGRDGYTGSQGIIGYTGSAGTNGYTGSQGSTGYAGSKGDTGAAGSQGLSTTIYNYKANANDHNGGDPSNTKLSWNNATQRSATMLYLSVNTLDGVDITVYLALLQNTQTFIIQDKNDAANYQNWSINGSVTNAGNYFTVPVTYVSSGGTGTSNFAQDHEIFLGLLVGAQGAIGYTGSRGYTGSAGYTGSVGYTGSLGYTGSQGVIGYTGSLGYTGSKGDIGYTGSFNGQIIATGTLNADYIQVEKSADQSSVAKNSDINFNTVTATNNGIAHTAGVFSLTAGKTYLLEATLAVNAFTSTSAFIWYSWVDATNNSQLDTSNGASLSTGSSGVVVPKTWTANDDYSSTARLVYTPATNQTVKLRATDGSGTCTVLAIGTRATIIQVSHTFALSALDTISTTGNVSVGGNLTVTGGVRKSARVLTTTTTLTVADAGGFIEFSPGASAYTVTLPDPTQAANSGIGYKFWQNTGQNITLSTPAGNFYGPSGSSASTKVLAQATTQYWDVWCDGYNWAVFGIKIA